MLKNERLNENNVELIQSKWKEASSIPLFSKADIICDSVEEDDYILTPQNRRRLAKQSSAPFTMEMLCKRTVKNIQFLYARKKRKTVAPPGFGIARFIGHFCTKRFRENVLEALHAEMLTDYFEHLAKKDYWRARCIRWMMGVHFLHAFAGGLLHRAIDLALRRKPSAIE